MKELSYYTAEVLRRANEKKAARKRAFKTAALCVPLAVAITAAALILPRFLRVVPDAGKEALMTEDAPISSEKAESLPVDHIDGETVSCEVTRLGFDGESFELSPDGAVEVGAIIEEIIGGASNTEAVDECVTEGYSIVLTSEGLSESYRFANGELMDSAGRRYLLTGEQAAKLLKLLSCAP